MKTIISQTKLNLLKKPFISLNTRTFAAYLKKFNAEVSLENNQSVAKLSDVSIDIKNPLEMLLGVLGSCELHTLQFHAGKRKVPLDKVELKINAEYDSSYFLGIKEGKNTYNFIEVEVNVYSKEADKTKLAEVVQAGLERCPVANTLKYAGIKFTEKVNYL